MLGFGVLRGILLPPNLYGAREAMGSRERSMLWPETSVVATSGV